MVGAGLLVLRDFCLSLFADANLQLCSRRASFLQMQAYFRGADDLEELYAHRVSTTLNLGFQLSHNPSLQVPTEWTF